MDRDFPPGLSSNFDVTGVGSGEKNTESRLVNFVTNDDC